MLRVLLAHPGTQHSHRLATELYRHRILDSFHTGLALSPGTKTHRILLTICQALKMTRQFQNRVLVDVPPSLVHNHVVTELCALARLHWGVPPPRVFRERNAAFQSSIPTSDIRRCDVVIGFDTSTLILAGRCSKEDKRCVLDQSIGHPRTLRSDMQHWAKRWPDWAASEVMKHQEQIEEEEAEHQKVGLIVVPSRFVARTLMDNNVDEDQIKVNPFGTDLTTFAPRDPPPSISGTLIFLFVGTVGVRKGIPLLLEAWRKLTPQDAELWIAGPGRIPQTVQDSCPPTVRWLGPVDRDTLPSLLTSAHVFVFPSLFEGLAIVQLEAAACGLPIIGTPRSGADEIIDHEKTGFLVEAGSEEALTETLKHLLVNRDIVVQMRARLLASRERLSWTHYGNRWNEILRGFCSG